MSPTPEQDIRGQQAPLLLPRFIQRQGKGKKTLSQRLGTKRFRAHSRKVPISCIWTTARGRFRYIPYPAKPSEERKVKWTNLENFYSTEEHKPSGHSDSNSSKPGCHNLMWFLFMNAWLSLLAIYTDTPYSSCTRQECNATVHTNKMQNDALVTGYLKWRGRGGVFRTPEERLSGTESYR